MARILITYLVIAVLVSIIITQIIVPLIKNRDLFPFLRKSYWKVEDKLSEARSSEYEAELNEKAVESEIKAAKKEVNAHIRVNQAHDDLITDAEQVNKNNNTKRRV